MANPTGPIKAAFLKTVKAHIVDVYEGNLGSNRHFQLDISDNEVGEIAVLKVSCVKLLVLMMMFH